MEATVTVKLTVKELDSMRRALRLATESAKQARKTTTVPREATELGKDLLDFQALQNVLGQ